MHRSQPLAAACFASVLAATAPAVAQSPDRAEILFNRGVEEMEARHYETACPAIEESYQLDPRPGVLFALAECEAQRGRIATAVAHYDEYLAIFAKLSRDKQRKQRDREKASRLQQAALGPQIPELTLTLPPNAPAGTVVKRDGAELSASALGMSLAVDPGVHLVTTQAPGGPVTELRVPINKGEKKQFTLKVRRASEPSPAIEPSTNSVVSPPPPPPPRADGPSGQRVVAYVVGAVGLTGVVLGGVMGGLALGQKSTVDAQCQDTACSPEGKTAADKLQTFGLVSTVGFIVGAASGVSAVVLFLTEPSPPKVSEGARTPVRGVSAGLLSAGPTEATFGLYGRW
jgi:hypothetical protein